MSTTFSPWWRTARAVTLVILLDGCANDPVNPGPEGGGAGGPGNAAGGPGPSAGAPGGGGAVNGGSTGQGGAVGVAGGGGTGVSGGAGGTPPAGGMGGPSTPVDGGTTTIVNHGCLLVPNAMGWADPASNKAGVQGAVFTYASKSSSITPLTDATRPFANAGDGKLCVKGSAAQVVGMDYATYFGAAMGIDLCYDNKTAKKYTLGSCPTSPKLVGLRFRVTGSTIPGELRVTFNEAGRSNNTYVLASQGANEAMFASGKVLYEMTAPPVNVANIDSIHFSIPTNTTAAVPFDFCVERIELVTRGGVCDMGAPAGGAGTPGMDGGAGVDPGTPTPGGSGVLPTNVSRADLSGLYEAWKTAYVRNCPGKGSYVANPQDGGAAYSEGIGYGMMLAVAMGDRPAFDAFWQFYQANRDGNGLMHWKVSGCGGVAGANSATDGDLDTAMALVQATCKWGSGYTQPARDLIGKIRAREIVAHNGLQVVKPGDAFNDPTCVNPSYLAPGFFRVFGRFTGDAAFWDKVATDSHTLLGRFAHPSTGLVPNWAHTDGRSPQGECGRPEATLYGYDAARTPWRLATDYRWWGAAPAKAHLTKIVSWVNERGIDAIGDKYRTDGTLVNLFHTPVTVGAFANASVVSNQATADRYYQALKAVTVNEYFPSTLKLLYLAFGAGLFDRCVK